jgi:hypothetical protein
VATPSLSGNGHLENRREKEFRVDAAIGQNRKVANDFIAVHAGILTNARKRGIAKSLIRLSFFLFPP